MPEPRRLKPRRTVKPLDLAKYARMADKYPHLECDGLSNVLAYEMRRDGYEPQILRGIVAYLDKRLPLHQWIEIDNQTIDFRLRMWFGEDAPHGLIEKQSVAYFKEKELPILPKATVDFLKLDAKGLFGIQENN